MQLKCVCFACNIIYLASEIFLNRIFGALYIFYILKILRIIFWLFSNLCSSSADCRLLVAFFVNIMPLPTHKKTNQTDKNDAPWRFYEEKIYFCTDERPSTRPTHPAKKQPATFTIAILQFSLYTYTNELLAKMDVLCDFNSSWLKTNVKDCKRVTDLW